MENRPKVVPAFFKTGHRYEAKYGLVEETLRPGVINWWAEIKSAGTYFGGPTGIYSIVVLMIWWGLLLKAQPSAELADYLHTLEDIDCTILSVIHNTPTASPPAASSSRASTVQPTEPRGSKRASPGEGPSRKRLRTGRA